MSNWMPLYHDMGLFGFHVCPVFAQSNHYLIDPVDFIKKPTIWLETIDISKSYDHWMSEFRAGIIAEVFEEQGRCKS